MEKMDTASRRRGASRFARRPALARKSESLCHGKINDSQIIDRRVFFQGRTTPRGNHFFAVRIYSEGKEP